MHSDDEMNNPLRNYKFKVFADGTRASIGFMKIEGLVEGHSDKIYLTRGIPESGYLLLKDWLARPPTTLVIGVNETIQFRLTNIEVNGLSFSDLDAGANALLLQTVRIGADVEVV